MTPVPASLKHAAASTEASRLWLAGFGLALCLVLTGVFDGTFMEHVDEVSFPLRISDSPLSGGVSVVALCLALAVVLRRRGDRGLRFGTAAAVALGAVLAVSTAVLFLGSAGTVPQAFGEAAGLVLGAAAILLLAFWAEALAPHGRRRSLGVLAAALVLDTLLGAVATKAFSTGAAAAFTVAAGVASPGILWALDRLPARGGDPGDAARRRQVGRACRAACPVARPSRRVHRPLRFHDGTHPVARPHDGQPGRLCRVRVLQRRKHQHAARGAARLRACASASPAHRDAPRHARVLRGRPLPVRRVRPGDRTRRHPHDDRRALRRLCLHLAADVRRRVRTGQADARPRRRVGHLYAVQHRLDQARALRDDRRRGVCRLHAAPRRLPRRAHRGGVLAAPSHSARPGARGGRCGAERRGRRPDGPTAEEVLARRCRGLAGRHNLTARELDVLVPLVRGRSAASIAASLGMSTETARTHIRHIYQKTGIHSREELMDAVEAGFGPQSGGAAS